MNQKKDLHTAEGEARFYGSNKDRKEKHRMRRIILMLLAALLCLAGCSAEEKMTYHQISQEEAKQMMARDDGHIIVDVRLGHVELTQAEMTELLGHGDITITISADAEK